ncbi:T9SS type A sorting domain-containing protein [candidate division KSB1 bacterium]|nr:T9SS type A sorting domain-containing protein [candidate division KSB1 bacterium]
MKNPIIQAALTIMIAFSFAQNGGCQIVNGSFETADGQPSLTGWVNSGGQSFAEAPPGGGNWSIEISGGCVWSHCCQLIPSIQDKEIWELKGWAKRANRISGGHIGWYSTSGDTPLRDVFIGDTVWTHISVQDTFSLSEKDTIGVMLMGGGGIVGWGGIYCDMIEIEKKGIMSSTDQTERSPLHSCLLQNYPNPFNASTMIRFFVPEHLEADAVSLKIFNLRGQHIRTLVDQPLQAGFHQIPFSAPDLASGMYFSLLQIGTMRLTGKMISTH